MKKSRFFKPYNNGIWTDNSFWRLDSDGSWWVKYPNSSANDGIFTNEWSERPGGPWSCDTLEEIKEFLEANDDWNVEFIEIAEEDLFLEGI